MTPERRVFAQSRLRLPSVIASPPSFLFPAARHLIWSPTCLFTAAGTFAARSAHVRTSLEVPLFLRFPPPAILFSPDRSVTNLLQIASLALPSEPPLFHCPFLRHYLPRITKGSTPFFRADLIDPSLPHLDLPLLISPPPKASSDALRRLKHPFPA